MHQEKGTRFERVLEIIPGLLSWSLLLAPTVFAFILPRVSVYIIVFYSAVWLIKSLEMAYHLTGAFLQIRKNKKKDFLREAKNIKTDIDFGDIYHIVILATFREPLSVLERSIKALLDSDFPVKEKVFFVLAYEEQEGNVGTSNFLALQKMFSHTFLGFFGYMHPKNMPGEVRGKGGNISFACKKVLHETETLGIKPENTVVTTLDADNAVSRQYLAYLSYEFISHEDRRHMSFQPLPFFNNNFWKVTLLNRVAAISSSFWQMIESHRPSRLRNFSAHAQSLATLIDTDFWSVKTIVEDGHQYWRTYFRYNGNHQVIPLFTEIFQDAVQADSMGNMLRNQYKQLRRWAWGVSDIPYCVIETIKRWKSLPKFKTVINLYRLFEGHLMWATLAITITLNNRLLILLNPDFGKTVLSYNASFILGRLFLFGLGGFFILIYMSLFFAPKRKTRLKDTFMILLQWTLLPLVTIIFGAFPALDAQTRLMLGKKLEFWSTPKSDIATHIGNGPRL